MTKSIVPRAVPQALFLLALLASQTTLTATTPNRKTTAPKHSSTPHAQPRSTRPKPASSRSKLPRRAFSAKPPAATRTNAKYRPPAIPREPLATRLTRDLTATPAPFAYPENLTPFFTALHAKAPTSQLRILQFGDSHTAADFFTGELRTRFQSTYGNGGLGFQFP